MCRCIQTNLTMELSQKLKKDAQNVLYGAITQRKKYLCKNLRVKEGVGHLLEGRVLSETYGIFRSMIAPVINSISLV